MLTYVDPDKFRTLIEIGALINSGNSGNSDYSNVHELLSVIVESAGRLCDAASACLLLVDETHGRLFFEVAIGFVENMRLEQKSIAVGEGIAGWTARHNKPLIINDVENSERRLAAIFEQSDFPLNAIIAVPMQIKERCVGVLEVINKKNDGQFYNEDLEWLEIFANQAALALQNAKNYEKVRDESAVLREQLEISGVFHTLIAKSPVMLEKLAVIDRLAATDSAVLILGESGSGKELAAEQIHLRSARRTGPFVRVNCAALPSGLAESELFGHVKGAFTGAVSSRMGRFEAAGGGTIFLDEVGDLPLDLQAKLLRVIQQKTFEKVGSTDPQTADVRILAATNKNIEKLVAEEKFRNDLYYRLNVLPIYVPPLRQRSEDIPELARFFLENCMRDMKKRFDGFSDEAMQALIAHAWPGNVRELENCVQRGCVSAAGSVITKEDLFPSAESAFSAGTTDDSRSLKAAMNAFKAHFIKKVLKEHNWNQTESAKALDIQRTYLAKMIRDFNITKAK
ncbi:MAG: sigma 54-interacting transcriptional regulator [Spirochaetaceae bacterium]|jgi:Nif-specific regulatory protein|nr:sigma 54-interacting transcriptional regulator [Spirochaetaceae bacterium]